MKTDRYTKAVLTVIALCLIWMSLGGPALLPVVGAQLGAANVAQVTAKGRVILPLRSTIAPGITVEPNESAVKSPFASLLNQPGMEATAPYAVLITNNTDNPVEALVVRYTGSNGRGGVAWLSHSYDSYSQASPVPAIRPRSSTLVTPAGYAREDGNVNAKMGPQMLARLESLETVELRLDSLILHDGQIVGADEFKIGDWLRARQSAAQRLIERTGKADGTRQGIAAAVADLASTRPDAKAGDSERLTQLYAQMLTSGALSINELTRYLNVPRLSR